MILLEKRYDNLYVKLSLSLAFFCHLNMVTFTMLLHCVQVRVVVVQRVNLLWIIKLNACYLAYERPILAIVYISYVRMLFLLQIEVILSRSCIELPRGS